jgi:dienelactone hydrolase
MRAPALALALALLACSSPARAATPAREEGHFRFTPAGDQKAIPERYRLGESSYDYHLTLKYRLSLTGLTVYRLQFPSPVKSPHPENNTVHAEYYLPRGKGPFPGVIVLDITGGDQSLSRGIATYLAQNGIAGLFVQMAYYGPRRPPGSRLRLLMPNYKHTLAAIRQTVLDMRVATAWMESRPELDQRQLGIMGTSLGSFMAALTAEMEPKLGKVAVVLGGGGFIDGYYDHPLAAPYRKLYEALGGTKEMLKKLIAPVDPLTCAANLKERDLLMIAASRDNIVPPKMARALWEAAGKQKIVWIDATHYSAVAYLPEGLRLVVEHFRRKEGAKGE